MLYGKISHISFGQVSFDQNFRRQGFKFDHFFFLATNFSVLHHTNIFFFFSKKLVFGVILVKFCVFSSAQSKFQVKPGSELETQDLQNTFSCSLCWKMYFITEKGKTCQVLTNFGSHFDQERPNEIYILLWSKKKNGQMFLINYEQKS